MSRLITAPQTPPTANDLHIGWLFGGGASEVSMNRTTSCRQTRAENRERSRGSFTES
jgi:hypothetical protein